MGNTLKLKIEDMDYVDPITENQTKAYEIFLKENKNLIMIGSAGTGKTFIGLYLALEKVLEQKNNYSKIVIVRSMVPTREIGFLPGNEEEKKDAYTSPYRYICSELFEDTHAWNKLYSITVKILLLYHL